MTRREFILGYLQAQRKKTGEGWVNSCEIQRAFQDSFDHTKCLLASSVKLAPTLRKLLASGWVERNGWGQYRIKRYA